MSTPMLLTTRNATLPDLVTLLRDQHARKVDIPVEASQIHAVDGHLQLTGTPPLISPDGVTPTTGSYRPTVICDEGIANKFRIPIAYMRRLREEAPDLWDANVNGWLQRSGRRYLLRGLRGNDGTNIARAWLSDRYKIVDNLDVLMAALDGVREAGLDVTFDGCDLTERHMYVRIVCEQVAALAPELLAGYRSPFTGAAGADNPLVFAGFVISNSETGSRAFTITPRLVLQVCRNGMTFTADAMKERHLGGRLDDGIVCWSADTHEKNLALITAQTRDAITSFLDVDYVKTKIAETTGAAGTPITSPDKVIELVAGRLKFSEDQQDAILAHFIRGGDLTAGGVMHAITSAAQIVADADLAYEMESQALEAMQLAAAHA
jgi:hypothetical protein